MAHTITVSGMSCEHCEETVAEAIDEVAGVSAVAVDRETETATVEGDVDPEALVDAVEAAGFDASA
jgi:copper chaperone CopZ